MKKAATIAVPEPARTLAEEAPRRVPTQERAKKRVERIIGAAAYVFAEEGYDAATMEGIAARAETSIGSIYQFFPNKLSLFEALARHYHERLQTFFDLLLGGPLLERPWVEILEDGIDALTTFHEQEPGFRAVWVGLQLTADVITEGEAINREFAKRIETVLAAKLPGLPARSRPVSVKTGASPAKPLTAPLRAGEGRRPRTWACSVAGSRSSRASSRDQK